MLRSITTSIGILYGVRTERKPKPDGNCLWRVCNAPANDRLLMASAELALVKAALLLTPVRITPLERLVILDMAQAVRHGTDVYEFGWDRLAAAVGREPGTKAAERAIERLTKALRDKQVIERIRVGGNGRTARYRLSILAQDADVKQEVAPHSDEKLPPTSDGVAPHFSRVAPHSDGGVREGKGVKEGAPPPCPKHPDGWHHSEACRACAAARKHAETRPTQSQMQTVQPGHHCAPGAHRRLADGTCLHCDHRIVVELEVAV